MTTTIAENIQNIVNHVQWHRVNVPKLSLNVEIAFEIARQVLWGP